MRRPYLFVALVFFPVLYVYSRYLFAPCDDTYIFLVYARNFIEGNGLTYNGTLVEGFSSVLWVALLALLGLLRVPLPLLAELLSAVSGLCVLLATYRLARRADLDARWALFPTALLVASGDVAFYSSCGLEHVAFAAFVAAGAAAIVRGDAAEARRTLRSYGYPLLLAFMILLRPEGALIAGLFLVSLAITCRNLLPAIRCGLVLSLLLTPVLLVKWKYFGYWLPNTYYAKSGAGLANVGQGFHYLGVALPRYGIVFVVSVVLVGLHLARSRRAIFGRVGPLLIISATWLLYILLLSGDNMVGGRVLIPILPLVYVALAKLLHNSRPDFGAGIRSTAVLALCLVVGYTADIGVRKHAGSWRESFAIRKRAGLFLKEAFPADTLAAVNVAGIIPYYSELPTIDMLGLNDEFIAHHGKRDRELRFGHQAGDGEYVLSQRPGVILFGGRAQDHAAAYLGDQEIWNSLTFRDDYGPVLMFDEAFAFVRVDLVGASGD